MVISSAVRSLEEWDVSFRCPFSLFATDPVRRTDGPVWCLLVQREKNNDFQPTWLKKTKKAEEKNKQ